MSAVDVDAGGDGRTGDNVVGSGKPEASGRVRRLECDEGEMSTADGGGAEAESTEGICHVGLGTEHKLFHDARLSILGDRQGSVWIGCPGTVTKMARGSQGVKEDHAKLDGCPSKFVDVELMGLDEHEGNVRDRLWKVKA